MEYCVHNDINMQPKTQKEGRIKARPSFYNCEQNVT